MAVSRSGWVCEQGLAKRQTLLPDSIVSVFGRFTHEFQSFRTDISRKMKSGHEIRLSSFEESAFDGIIAAKQGRIRKICRKNETGFCRINRVYYASQK